MLRFSSIASLLSGRAVELCRSSKEGDFKVDVCQTLDIKEQIQENITFPVPESGSNEQNQ